MPVTRAVIDLMIANGVPAEQAAGLADCMQITRIEDVNAFLALFPEMNFTYAMTVRREFRVSFIRWHNAHCLPENAWHLADDDGTWEDVDWPTFEENIKAEIIQLFSELPASHFVG